MKITHLAHTTFRVANMDASLRFYEEDLGLRRKFHLTVGELIEIYVASYAKTEAEAAAIRSSMERRRDAIGIVYFEVAPQQFIELFSAEMVAGHAKTKADESGYLHFALEVDDIHEAKKELEKRGVKVISDVNLGPDHTYQLWIEDPDGNEVELMEYTDRSYQLVGRLSAT